MSISQVEKSSFHPLTHVTTIYCTVQAIIQGVALVLLAEQCFHEPNLDTIGSWWPYGAACLLYVIQITYKYTVLMAGPYSRSEIGPVDIGVVTVLGMFEFIPMFYVVDSHDRWRWAYLCWFLALFGVLAYGNTYRNLQKSHSHYGTNETTYQAALWNTKVGTGVLILLVIFLTILLYGMHIPSTHMIYPTLIILYCLFTIAYDHWFMESEIWPKARAGEA